MINQLRIRNLIVSIIFLWCIVREAYFMCNSSVNFRSFSWRPSVLQVCV